MVDHDLLLSDELTELLTEATGALESTLDSLMTGEMAADDLGAWVLNLQSLLSELSCLVSSIEDALDHGDFAA